MLGIVELYISCVLLGLESVSRYRVKVNLVTILSKRTTSGYLLTIKVCLNNTNIYDATLGTNND